MKNINQVPNDTKHNPTDDQYAGMPAQLVDAMMNGNIGEVEWLTKGTYPLRKDESDS